jgi:hypothetical protein
MSTGAKVAIGLAVGFVGLFVVLIAAVTLLGSNASTEFDQVGQSIGGPSPTSADRPDDPSDSFTLPEGFTKFDDPDGAFALGLPPSWVTVPLDAADLDGAGGRVSDDPTIAKAIDDAIAQAAGNIVFFAVDGADNEDPFVANLNILSFEAPATDQAQLLEQINLVVKPQLEGLGVTGFVAEAYDSNDLIGAAVTYSSPPGATVAAKGLQFYLADDDTVWVLTFTSDHLDEQRATFYLVASSFDPG